MTLPDKRNPVLDRSSPNEGSRADRFAPRINFVGPGTRWRGHVQVATTIDEDAYRDVKTFRITQARRMCERVVLISAVGKINAIGARNLDQMIDRVLVARNLSRLVIDLTRVTHFSKREVDALLHARELALRTGIELRVVTAGRLVDDVLRKRHATDMFHLSPDVDGACI